MLIPNGSPIWNWGSARYSGGVVQLPVGAVSSASGCQFEQPYTPKVDHARLSYSVAIPPDFEWVLGGKLPGLYGGTHLGGDGSIPDGTNGFSVRPMWNYDGGLSLLVASPKNSTWGDATLAGSPLRLGATHRIEIDLQLNTPGQSDGVFVLSVDGKELLIKTDRFFRTVPTLQIEGLFFSVFYGGSTPDWAPKSSHVLTFSQIELN